MESFVTHIFGAGEEERWMDLIWELACSGRERRSGCGSWGRSALEPLHVLKQDEQWERDNQVSQTPAC